jgi:type IV pilus assembly protein PilC
MLFKYEAISNTGEKKAGTVDAVSRDLAITAIQRRGLIVSSISEDKGPISLRDVTIFGSNIKLKDVVIMSRQIATLFGAQISALRAFTLLATNTENRALVKVLNTVAEDIQSGSSISISLSKHPDVFSTFYVNMVKAGEESGKLNQTFSYLADYLDRQYQLTSKTKHALIYPAFVVGVFIVVIVMMFTFIVPKLAEIIRESGQAIPFSTKIILGISDLLVRYWIFLLLILISFFVYLINLSRSQKGKRYLDNLKISLPVFKNIYIKLYLSRIADNMDTMLSSGVTILRALELTGVVVGNVIFEDIIKEATEDIKKGVSLSEAFSKYPEIPSIMSGMIKVGEETGSLSNILRTLGKFYNREVNEAVDTLVSLIEPLMIVALGLGVGLLLAAVLMPIYNIAGGIS